MLEKTFTPKRTICKVTFSIPADWAEEKVNLAGDFNDWDEEAESMELKDGKWEITMRLKPENNYRFKYLVDGKLWKNDDDADSYESNIHGTEDSVVEIGK